MKPQNFFPLLFIFFSFFSFPLYSTYYQLVAVAVFQNETFFLKEWLDFHKKVGVEHFYLFNNQSTDDFYPILKPYLEKGEVELFHINFEAKNQQQYLDFIQLPAYNQALSMLKKKAKWVAFLDLDEFLFPCKDDHLLTTLASFTPYAAVAVNWQIFGTSWLDHLKKNQSLLSQLILKAPVDYPLNQTVKLIVQPSFVKKINHPHYFEYQKGFFAVNSQQTPLEPNTFHQPVLIDLLCINHYWFGTSSFFEKEKLPRRKKWGFCLNQKMINRLIHQCNVDYDTRILRFINQNKAVTHP